MKKPILTLAFAVVLTSLVGTMRSQSVQLQSDFELSPAGPGEVTQPGWITQGVAKFSNTNELSLTPTQSGLDTGIAASLVGNTNWESRGGSIEGRALVTGTSFNDLVSDFWVLRDLSFNLNFSGLAIGATYVLRSWHNDSYTINQGFAAGGGIVRLSATDATVLSEVDGTVTNLKGSQSDSNFGIGSISFVPTSSTSQITFTRIGGNITALPVNGLQLTQTAVPEPSTYALFGIGAIGMLMVRRRKKTV